MKPSIKPLVLVCTLFSVAACAPKNEAVQSPPVAATADAPKVPAGAYTLDKTHASLVFRLSHMGFSNYTASFERFDVQLQFDPVNLGASSVVVTVDPTSLLLINPPPGFTEALLGEQWLDAKQYPTMTYRSTKVEATTANNLRITGDLTLHGVTHPVVLDAVFNGGYPGFAMDPHARIGFSAQGTLKRSDFGIAFGIPAPGSNMGVSDDVDVVIEAELSGPAWSFCSSIVLYALSNQHEASQRTHHLCA
jgi:polyisoprenoid-binding protein YceI